MKSRIKGVEIIEILSEKFEDVRGWLKEVYRSDETDFCPEMCYISMTKPGVARGPHEHVEQDDFFVFSSGKFLMCIWENRVGEGNYNQIETYVMGKDNPCSIRVPKGVVHAYKNIGEEDSFVINFPDRLYAGKNKKDRVDEIRHEDESGSVFRIPLK